MAIATKKRTTAKKEASLPPKALEGTLAPYGGKVPDDVVRLLEQVKSYNPKADLDLIVRAYEFSKQAHFKQKRASGEPYLTHPVAVALILASKYLDTASIVTGLLHDTVEDTSVDLDQIRQHFGEEVMNLVDGVTKLGTYQYRIADSKHAQNFRKFLLAAAGDIRVLLVKLADRLHNMRTISFLKSKEKQRQKAEETLEIYASLTSRIGLNDWQQEFEEIYFRTLHPEAWKALDQRRRSFGAENEDLIKQIIAGFQKLLTSNGLKGRVIGREKSLYSIWRKMREKNHSFENLVDVFAFRIIVDDIASCYAALGYLHASYHAIAGRFKDYISVPKPNNYRSIHTGVITDNHLRVEVQIRTEEMDREADLGIAAHWHYKEAGSTRVNYFDGRRFSWLRQLILVLEDSEGARELIENTKLEFYADSVFVFTPNGELISLPKNATLLDFAYAVHTDVGHRCVGAKINGKIRPLRSTVANGDTVEIQTLKSQEPSPEWEHFCVTGKARAAIRRYLRAKSRSYFIDLGKRMLEKKFADYDCHMNDTTLGKALAALDLGYKSTEQLMQQVGEGIVTPNSVVFAANPKLADLIRAQKMKLGNEDAIKDIATKPREKFDVGLAIDGLVDGLAVSLGKCCNALPGDRIVGIITTGKGVTIHRRDCDNLHNFADAPERWLTLRWDTSMATDNEKFIGQLFLMMENRPGAIADITSNIASHGANISNFQIPKRAPDFFEVLIDVEVQSLEQLNMVMNGLSRLSVVNEVARSRV